LQCVSHPENEAPHDLGPAWNIRFVPPQFVELHNDPARRLRGVYFGSRRANPRLLVRGGIRNTRTSARPFEGLWD
jgi:hypothetical protein